MALTPRKLADKLTAIRPHFPVLSILGPRQSGKTTLAKNLFNDLPYVTLEDNDTRRYALEDPRGFLNNISQGGIIDEVQYAPELFSYLQTHVDSTQQKGRFILTGSQNFLMHSKITQSLAGRVALSTLLPLSAEEQGLPYDFSTHILRGGYPGVKDMPEDALTVWFNSYIQTYIERDVRTLSNIGDLSKFHKFLELCANRVGQILNITSLAEETGIARQTANHWLSLLEASFVVFLLKPFHKNYNKRLIKNPKLYFYDTGIASYLIGLRTNDQLQQSYLRGSLVENWVISELYKAHTNRLRPPQLYFWRDQTGHEIDCFVETPSAVKVIEIKSSETIQKEYFKNIEFWKKIAGVSDDSAKDTYLIHGGDRNEVRTLLTIAGWKMLADTCFVNKMLE